MVCDFCGNGKEPNNDGFSSCSICGATCHDYQDGGGYCMEQHRKTHSKADYYKAYNLEPFTFTPTLLSSERVVEFPLSYEAAWHRLVNIINDTDIFSISIEKLKSLMLECLTNATNTSVR